jgi:hypothetical protein
MLIQCVQLTNGLPFVGLSKEALNIISETTNKAAIITLNLA